MYGKLFIPLLVAVVLALTVSLSYSIAQGEVCIEDFRLFAGIVHVGRIGCGPAGAPGGGN